MRWRREVAENPHTHNIPQPYDGGSPCVVVIMGRIAVKILIEVVEVVEVVEMIVLTAIALVVHLKS